MNSGINKIRPNNQYFQESIFLFGVIWAENSIAGRSRNGFADRATN